MTSKNSPPSDHNPKHNYDSLEQEKFQKELLERSKNCQGIINITTFNRSMSRDEIISRIMGWPWPPEPGSFTILISNGPH